MLKKSSMFGDKTRVTFSLPGDEPPGDISVVGDFNEWQPGQHKMQRRRNGTRSVSVVLGPGAYRFRYLASGGVWLNDDSAERSGDDSIVQVLTAAGPVRARPTSPR